MTITEVPHTTAPETTVSHPPTAVSDTPEFVSETAPQRPIKPGRDWLMTALLFLAASGGTAVGIIGFAMSYSTLAKVALSWGFSERLAPWFPVGVDASIIAFLALDLYLIYKNTPWPVLRMAAHAMTGATIWFNASSQGSIGADLVKSASHGVMPLLFVIGVEAARRLFIKKARLQAGTAADGIPLHRWILSPLATPRFYRRMRLYGIASYPEMIRRQQDLLAYEQWLKRKHQGDLSKASEDERLPMKMAAYGYTVAEALALPDQQEREAEERAEEAERRRLAAETRREVALKEAEAERLEADGALEEVRARVEGQTAEARARARAQASAADRAAELEEKSLGSALVAEAQAREAEALRLEAEERERAAEADRRAAGVELDAAETRRRAVEADRRAAEEEERKAAAEANAQDARERAAEADRRVAETRLATAEIERHAVEIEDAAKLTPRERAVRRVARMILAAGGDANQVLLADIQRETAVSSTDTASKYRQEAVDLLREGYRPE
jgi:hypothetical protein